jgi:gliding motility-associated-like protein
MTPASTGVNVYGAALVKGDATNDGYNVTLLDDSLCAVNPNFYHRLYHSSGADAADLAMYYNPSSDGNWTDEAHWKNNKWNYIGASTLGNALGFSSVTVGGVSDFTPEPFALANKKFTLDAGPDVQIAEGQSTTFNPVIGANGSPSIMWLPNTDLSCSDCATPVASPTTTTRYFLTVTNGAGCSVTDSLLVQIKEPVLLIPTAFSPNGDGENDVFHILNKNIDKLHLEVYNRWGELVYEAFDITEGWDGTYKNARQDIGVYVWQCTYTFIGETRSRFAKGNVTLVR